ncbi:PQQ-dependent sugar dehydrogenase [Dactylosporangium fulvum]|uniref:PQQ-dependent sugar dehydrogenase n=1 Tax=Dactylosporangium fulvum TaxID=53359 RepID=A0ABY5WBA6_9ACTN|nr:PQQ-dependent sugar dehydrogenase [Dactylosporangium fulvum]UWP86802.1 PQQ-dependent sugar dehydrogenase [Dactylosporangium fulvum]
MSSPPVRHIIAGLAAVLCVATGVVAAAAPAVADTVGPITGIASGKCVDVPATTVNGTQVQLYTCNGTAAQTWTVGTDSTVRTPGNKCLDVAGGVNANGTKVQIWDCSDGNPNQRWTYSDSARTLVNPATGRCLDVAGGSTADAAKLHIWACNPAVASQQWGLAGGPPPAFTDYQAESAAVSQGVVESNHAGYTGTGFVNYDNVIGSYVQFTVSVPAAGMYPLALRYANGTTVDRPMDITVNGAPAAPGVSFPGTGGWPTWVDRTVTASLTAGTNTIRAAATTSNGGPNLDRLRVTAPSDGQPPSAPANLRVVGAVRPTGVDLAWNASTDNVGVARYVVYNGGNVVTEVGGNILAATVPLQPNTSYVFSVLAYDAAGNPSQGSNNLPVTAPPSTDTQPPTTPAGLRSTAVTASTVTLAWNASTDNVGVRGYRVSRDGTQIADVPDLTASDTGLAAATTYRYTVVAYDANGNTSPAGPALAVTTSSQAGGGDPIFDRNVNTQLDLPWGIAFLPDGSALVAERDRFEIVRVTPAGQKTVVGTIAEAVTTSGEGGLLGLAVGPTFATDHWVYAFHTAASDNRLVRFKFENGAIGPREALVTGIAKNRFHNGGRVRFGPDGYLYVTTGDAQDSSRAQNPSSLNGKILRVTTTGAAAPGNPFGTRVYSLGHRNPQGLAWDSQGRLWSSEFGDNTWDELNLITAGANYGWPTCEGACGNPSFTDPVRQWSTASASPSGIEIVNDWIYMAAVRGTRLWVMRITGATTDTPRAFFNGSWGRLRTVVKTPDGGLWLTSTNNDMNGGTPTVLTNVIVRLRFAS